MKVKDIIELLNCEVITPCAENLEREVNKFVASDLMSDVLIIDDDIDVLVTSLSTVQALRTSDIVCACCVVIVNNKPIMADMNDMAMDLDLTLLRTKLTTFEACSKISAGLNK